MWFAGRITLFFFIMTFRANLSRDHPPAVNKLRVNQQKMVLNAPYISAKGEVQIAEDRNRPRSDKLTFR
jgi:hypothetical protein